MAKKKKKSGGQRIYDLAEGKTPEPTLTKYLGPTVSTRNLERPKGSIRIVPGRKDAKS